MDRPEAGVPFIENGPAHRTKDRVKYFIQEEYAGGQIWYPSVLEYRILYGVFK